MGSSSTPPGPNSDRPARLLKLAEARFGDQLTDADRRFFRATANGEVADYGDGDPAEADKWGMERTLQADRIRWLCTDPKAANEVLPHEGIKIKGARIEGQLWLSYGKLDFPLAIKQSVIPEGIVMQRAHVAALFLDGTHTGLINADGLQVDHGLHMRKGFRADGEVRLLGATIGGDLDCRNGHFSNSTANGFALSADRINVAGTVSLSEGFQANGEVRLLGATIGGNLGCVNGHFSNPNARGYTLNADGIKVTGAVFLSKGFQADGEVRLVGATIGSNLECDNAHFSNPDANRVALFADGVKVTGSAFLRESFWAEGRVDFTSATVKEWFIWRGVDNLDQCTLLDLESASIGTLWDEEASWPKKLALDGLVYDRLYRGSPLGAQTRVDNWIRRHDHEQYLPQPYEQLAKMLKEMGHEREARKVLIAKNKDPARLRAMSRLGRVGHAVLGLTIGYGYLPWRALFWILEFLVIGFVVFGCAAATGNLVEVDQGTAQGFNAGVYSLDAFVPLIDVHQAKYWQPTHKLVQAYLWVHILSGWLLTTLLVVGLTGLVRR